MSKATVFHLDPEHPNLRRLGKVVDILKKGEVIIYPTDTIYGIGCDIHKKKAIEKIYAMKGLGSKHLMSFICKDLSQAAKYVNIDNRAYSILKRILPGPYTIILEANRDVPKVLLGKRRTVGIRIPASPVANYLVENLGSPIVSSSTTNRSGESLLDPEDIYNEFGSHVSAIIDMGFLGNDNSTVLSYENSEWEVIREGKGPVDFLE
jgi:tRNA threonylcarbamoyl adenosine modification protein (Sua5/YciO/YrdC/YwlC family)